MAETVYYIALQKGKGVQGLSYRYMNLQKSINNHSPLMDSTRYKDIPSERLNLCSDGFNKLVMLLVKNGDYLRATSLLINAGKLMGCAKGAMAAVALETITNIICKDVSTKKIIEDKQIAGKFKYELNKTAKTLKHLISDKQFKLIKDKIDKINTGPNAQKLEDAFRLLGIELDEDEKDCLKFRNRLLHGSLPKDKKYKMLTEDELTNLISDRLIMLCSMLLLKQVGYEGHLIDRGITQLVKKRAIMKGELLESGNSLRSLKDPYI